MRALGYRDRWLRIVLTSLGLAAIYVLTGRLGLLLAVPPGYATAIFPPAGVAISAMLVLGPATLPGTFLGSLLLNLWVGYAIAQLLTVAAIATAQASLEEQGALLEQLGGAVVRWRYPVTRQDFRELVSKLLQHFSTIQAVEWAPRVEAADRRAFEAQQAAELPGFAVRERDPAGSLHAAAQRASFIR